MDTSAEEITFDGNGNCNFCESFLNKKSNYTNNNIQKKQDLENLISEIKENGEGKKYDCIVGVSGGVDSSWVLVQAVKLGLKPLAVHMDNGWNSELAQSNIENLIKTLNIDLYTYVINWSEYRKIMNAFFDADVIDVELLYDNAMLTVNYRLAKKYNIKYILSGMNQSTEGMAMPEKWNWFKYDKKNIKSISKKYQKIKLKSFPSIGTYGYIWNTFVRQIKWVHFLDFIDYKKKDVLPQLIEEYKYKPYPYKHYESIFTRFYQGYLLPKKFNVDKRRVHLSTLIMTNQLSRNEAIDDLQRIPYENENELEQDKKYFLKKMGWTENQLNNYINRPRVEHSIYQTEIKFWKLLSRMYRKIKNTNE